jgi:hypothetical protein
MNGPDGSWVGCLGAWSVSVSGCLVAAGVLLGWVRCMGAWSVYVSGCLGVAGVLLGGLPGCCWGGCLGLPGSSWVLGGLHRCNGGGLGCLGVAGVGSWLLGGRSVCWVLGGLSGCWVLGGLPE